jgi:hypothetical protein
VDRVLDDFFMVPHGLSWHPLYPIWNAMMARCYNPNLKQYKDYGGRGITVCDHWHDVKNFIVDMQFSYRRGLCLDRLDNDGNYEPSNCAWTTRVEQNSNTRKNIIFRGETASVASRRLGMGDSGVTARIHAGWTYEEAFSIPKGKQRPRS